MSNRKRLLRLALQALALLLVAWGIAHSVRNAANQLNQQRQTLNEQATQLLDQAATTDDPTAADAFRSQAEARTAQASNFWQASPFGLLLAATCYALGMLPASYYWRHCLFAVGQPAPTNAILWAYFYGNLGKYFPGKAMVILLRLATLERYGVRRVATSITIFLETLTMMSVGGAVAAVCLILLNLDWKLTLLALGLLVSTFAPTWPPLLRILLSRLQPGVDAATLTIWTNRIDWRLIVRGWGMLLLTWLGFGLSLWLVLTSLPIAQLESTTTTQLALSSFGACALAVVLGFVSMIPGGAGVREVVLSTILTPVVGPAAALCGAVWMRIVWLATELLMAGLTGSVHYWYGHQPPSTTPTEPGGP